MVTYDPTLTFIAKVCSCYACMMLLQCSVPWWEAITNGLGMVIAVVLAEVASISDGMAGGRHSLPAHVLMRKRYLQASVR